MKDEQFKKTLRTGIIVIILIAAGFTGLVFFMHNRTVVTARRRAIEESERERQAQEDTELMSSWKRFRKVALHDVQSAFSEVSIADHPELQCAKIDKCHVEDSCSYIAYTSKIIFTVSFDINTKVRDEFDRCTENQKWEFLECYRNVIENAVHTAYEESGFRGYVTSEGSRYRYQGDKEVTCKFYMDQYPVVSTVHYEYSQMRTSSINNPKVEKEPIFSKESGFIYPEVGMTKDCLDKTPYGRARYMTSWVTHGGNSTQHRDLYAFYNDEGDVILAVGFINGRINYVENYTDSPIPGENFESYARGIGKPLYNPYADVVDPDDHDIEGYYEDNRDIYKDYDDAYDGFLDDEDAWNDY